MELTMLKLISSIVVLTSLASAPAMSTELRRESLMEALRSGGYTIILRHARTDRSIPVKETPGYTPKDRADQRNLTEDGVRDAKLIGVVLRKYRIPIGEIVSSPLYRTVETAELSVGKPTRTTMDLRVFPSNADQAALVAAPVKAGTNRLIVTHHFVIETHVPGIKPGDIGESEAAVVRATSDGKVELVGRISLSDWEKLGGVAPSGGGNGIPAKTVTSSGAPKPAASAGATSSLSPDQIATAYVAAFNSGKAAMRGFIESHLVVNPERPTEERLKTYDELFNTHGTLTFEMVHAKDATEATFEMKSKVGSFQLVVRAADGQPGRAASVSFRVPQMGGHR
jgi:phosphohistidine phosphatase SixA